MFKLEAKEAHPAHDLVQKHGVKLSAVAEFLGISYYHCSHILNGRAPVSRRIKPRLEKLVKHLEKREVK